MKTKFKLQKGLGCLEVEIYCAFFRGLAVLPLGVCL